MVVIVSVRFIAFVCMFITLVASKQSIRALRGLITLFLLKCLYEITLFVRVYFYKKCKLAQTRLSGITCSKIIISLFCVTDQNVSLLWIIWIAESGPIDLYEVIVPRQVIQNNTVPSKRTNQSDSLLQLIHIFAFLKQHFSLWFCLLRHNRLLLLWYFWTCWTIKK